MAPSDETDYYSCNDCPRVFLNKLKLKAHQKAHQVEKLLRVVNSRHPVILLRDISARIRKECPTCGKYILQDEFDDHVESHLVKTDEQEKKSLHWNSGFKVIQHRPKKVKRRSSNQLLNQWGMHKCLQCGIIFNKEINLRIHKLKKHNTKSPYSCIVCEKKFLSRIRLESHQSSHSNFKSFTYNPTMPELEYNNGIDINNSSSSASQPPELNPEGESSKTSNDTADIEGDAYETCLTCGDAIAGCDILVHITTHLQPGQTDCLHCDFEASHQKDLLDHMTVHYGLKAYACIMPDCDKAYHWKHSLARHMANSHAAANPFQCASCTESFSTLREERRHALTHVTKESLAMDTESLVSIEDRKTKRLRPFKCQHCDKRFMKKKQARAHEAIHMRPMDGTPKQKYVAIRRIYQPVYSKPRRKKNNESNSVVVESEKRACKTCGEEMILSELLIHIKTHVTKEQRQCELCQHVYANVESLREHMHTHYGLEPHKCTICEKTYSLKQSVLNHIIRNHKAVKPLEFYACTIPVTPKAIKEHITLTPKKPRNTKQNGNFVVPSVTPPTTPFISQGSPTPINLSSHFGIVQQQLQVHSTPSPLSSRGVSPSTSNGQDNGFGKKSTKPVNFQCNFCSRVFTTKFSVQRHEAKLHNYLESDHKRTYKTTYATAEDSSDAYGVDSQSDFDQSWLGDGKLSALPDITISYNNGNINELKQESLRSEIRSLLLEQEHSTQDLIFKEIPTNLY